VVTTPEMRELGAPDVLTWEIHEEEGGLTRLTVIHELEDAPHTLAADSNDEGLRQGGGGGRAWILSDLESLLDTGASIGG
jgi:hypothetical protein